MSDYYWISEAQLKRIKPHFPRSHGKPRVDDRRVISGIVHVIRNDLRWRDAPEVYGSHKTLYNRFVRWSRMGIFDRILSGLVSGGPEPDGTSENCCPTSPATRPAQGSAGLDCSRLGSEPNNFLSV